MQIRTILTLALVPAMLAACNSAEDTGEDTAAAPAPQLTSTPTPTVDAAGAPLAAGSWSVGESAEGATASFGQSGEEPRIAISCNRAGKQISLLLAGDAGGPQAYMVESGGTAARLDMTPDAEATLPTMRADIAANAPVFGGFVQPGGSITITSPTGEVLRLPASTGIRRVFEACA